MITERAMEALGHQNDTVCHTARVLSGVGQLAHHKPGIIQQLVQKTDPAILQYAANVRDNFEQYVLKKLLPKAAAIQVRQQL